MSLAAIMPGRAPGPGSCRFKHIVVGACLRGQVQAPSERHGKATADDRAPEHGLGGIERRGG